MKALIVGVLAGIAVSAPLERRIRQLREAHAARKGFAYFLDDLAAWQAENEESK